MKISASILGAEDRVECVTKLNKTNTSYIHVDVMDGKFVSNTQFNKFNEVNAINMVSKYPLDIHLMVNNPYDYVIQYKNMNVEFITFHVEVDSDKKRVIDEIHNMGYKVGLAIKSNTDISELEPYLDIVDMVLVMSVEPGLGGQEFISGTVDKIKKVRELIGDRNILVEVDGGINDKTIDLVKDVDIAVVGSYITSSDDYYGRVEKLLKSNENIDMEGNKTLTRNYFSLLFKINIVAFCVFCVFSLIFGFQFCLLNSCTKVFGVSSIFFTLLFYLFISIPFNSILIIIIFVNMVNKNVKNYSSVDDRKKHFRVALIIAMIIFVSIMLFLFLQ